MSPILSGLNAAVTWLFDLGFAPLRGLSPVWALTLFSVVTGVGMLWIFGKVSDQETIRIVRDRIRGNLIGIRLFGDDLRTLFTLQGRLLRDNGLFLRHALVPMLILMIPLFFILAQLNLRFSTRPLGPGAAALVKVKMDDRAGIPADLKLETPAGLAVETPGVRIPAQHEVSWRIRALEAGAHRLRVTTGATGVEKDVLVGDRWGAVPTLRSQGLADLVLYPGESAIPKSSPIRSIQITYPALEMSILGWSIHWLLFFFVVSLVAGFAFRKVLGVEI